MCRFFVEAEVTGISLTAITLAGLSAVLRSMRAVWQHDLLMDTATSVTLGGQTSGSGYMVSNISSFTMFYP